MTNPFSKFETFGAIADSAQRKKLAQAIYAHITAQSHDEIGFNNVNTDNFASAIKAILAHETMKKLCKQDLELGEKITQDILDFINKTKKQINKTQSLFEAERGLLTIFGTVPKTAFHKIWENNIKPSIKLVYPEQDLDLNFYEAEFKRSLIDTEKISFDSVKDHFIEKWDELLVKKQTKWEIDLIDEQRKAFCEALYQQIDALKNLQEALAPFTNQLGRLWDMSRGNWQRANFDTLKRYSERLKNDKSVNDLAEMLGKMRQAEKEFEEVLFSSISLKPEWKIQHAHKSDLIGIKESDDLSSLLPSETALLADETLQFVFFKKFVEKKLQTFDYQAKTLSYKEETIEEKRQKEAKKGPFIICIDTSGSMHGTPEIVAKTLCLALLKMSIRDNRKCYLISFSTGIETLNLSDLKNSLNKIIDFLSMSFHGGTDATPALHEALRMLTTQDYKKADIIMVSDFVMPTFDDTIQTHIKSARDNKTKFHSLVIGNSANSSTIKEFDNNWFYDLDNPKNVLTLIKNLSSL